MLNSCTYKIEKIQLTHSTMNLHSFLPFLLTIFSLLPIPTLTQTAPPNILFIMVDDMGYADLGCYGGQVIQTPHIDRLASEGMRFEQCYTGSPVCAPSRSVLMTGLHTGHTTVRGNFGKTGVVGLGGGKGRVPLKDGRCNCGRITERGGICNGHDG